MNIEELEAKMCSMEYELNVIKDKEEIKQLQRIYGFYLEHWMADEIVDLFADGPDVFLHFPEGKYMGKETVKKYFKTMKADNPEFLHQLMQLSPVISIDSDGKTAKGRFFCFGAIALPQSDGVFQIWGSGTYENEYVKEDGKWKIKGFKWIPNYMATPGKGWVAPERVTMVPPTLETQMLKPDVPPEEIDYKYPSGNIFPFHFRHPITGKKSTEDIRNENMKRIQNK